ncbi:hypothetical protein ABID14_001202 [Peptoniphilus olsenii]|uniref:Uncharacterized protein n=1 Tax=Peptoniphilus olsenii TaxID=411570 RepID=A0ABV2JAE8_9FIRM
MLISLHFLFHLKQILYITCRSFDYRNLDRFLSLRMTWEGKSSLPHKQDSPSTRYCSLSRDDIGKDQANPHYCNYLSKNPQTPIPIQKPNPATPPSNPNFAKIVYLCYNKKMVCSHATYYTQANPQQYLWQLNVINSTILNQILHKYFTILQK